jgi:serine/threonine protein kinase/tetratricopeptide (TPR) repeat protein
MTDAPSACPDVAELEALASGAEVDGQVVRHVDGCPACRERLEELRDNAALFSRFLESGVREAAREPAVPASIPGYEVIEEIHRGAQGVVFRAVQESTSRPVALKILLSGAFATSQQRRRFEREIELVASLEHPNVVTVYDSGTTDDGNHWLAMQLVDGVTLDAWLAARRVDGGPGLEETVHLFGALCAGVGHAHQHGVIHRDLKPANIIVDGAGVPHVVDFGLARPATDADAARSGVTSEGSFLGTLAYASPEHVTGDPTRVDVRSDIYALGVMLYEVLDGNLPTRLDGELADVLRAISEDDPPHLGRRSSRAGPPALPVDFDLATIVHTALAKDPDRRYQHAAAFRDDLRAFLAGDPISARRDSTWYVFRKSLRRHRLPVSLAAGFLLAILGFLAVLLVQNHRIRVEVAKLQQINIFLEDTLGSVQAADGEGTVTVRDLLDEAVQWIGIALADEPEVAASIRITVGGSYRNLGLYEAAEEQLQAALETRRELFGNEHVQIAQSLNALALLRHRQGRYDDAEALYREALDLRRRLLGEVTLPVSLTLANLALLHLDRGDPDGAEELLQASLAVRRELYGEAHQDIAMCLFNLARVSAARGDSQQAEERHRAALAMRRDVLPPKHPDLPRSLEAVARLAIADDRAADAADLLAECLDLRLAALPEEHWLIARTRSELGAALTAAGRPDEAVEQLTEAEAVFLATFGADDVRTRLASARLETARRRSGGGE